MFTEAVCRVKEATTDQVVVPVGWEGVSRHIFTVPSYEEEASIAPYLGWACGREEG